MTANGPGAAPRAPQTSAANLRAAKDALRRATLATRSARDPYVRLEADAARLPRVLEVCAGRAAIACYASSGDEPDTWAIIDALADAGVRVLLPVLRGRREPAWSWYAGRRGLAPGWRGILEPTGPALPAQALQEVSLVWASALLATPAGDRLGTGGGWYDRALAHRTPDVSVGVPLDDSEVVATLPRDPWDIAVDLVVTPSHTVRCNRPAVAE